MNAQNARYYCNEILGIPPYDWPWVLNKFPVTELLLPVRLECSQSSVHQSLTAEITDAYENGNNKKPTWVFCWIVVSFFLDWDLSRDLSWVWLTSLDRFRLHPNLLVLSMAKVLDPILTDFKRRNIKPNSQIKNHKSHYIFGFWSARPHHKQDSIHIQWCLDKQNHSSMFIRYLMVQQQSSSNCEHRSAAKL